MDSNDLIRRIAAATGATINAGYDDEYTSSYTGASWGKAVGGTLGAAATHALAGFARQHQGLLMAVALVSIGTTGAALLAQAMGRALQTPGALAVGYVVMVTVSGIVAAVAVNALGEPVSEFVNIEDFH